MSDASTFDEAIRPTKWEHFIGQVSMKARLAIAIEAAVNQKRQPDPILLVSDSGTGKTTLGMLIAEKMFAECVVIQMPIKPEPFFDLIEDMDEGVVVLDELHSAPKGFQEMLQPALQEKVLMTPDFYRIDTSRILFVGATIPEFEKKLLAPLHQRFEIRPTWEPYTRDEIAQIMAGMASRLGFEMDPAVWDGLAGACGATPRLAKRFVKAARDLLAVGETATAGTVLAHVGVDAEGLSAAHLEYLEIVRRQRRIGLQSLANLMGRSAAEITDLDRELARRGYVHLSGNGRRLTPEGRAKVRPQSA